ncbi:MAG: protein kinase [Elusimicrobiota bacterium]
MRALVTLGVLCSVCAAQQNSDTEKNDSSSYSHEGRFADPVGTGADIKAGLVSGQFKPKDAAGDIAGKPAGEQRRLIQEMTGGGSWTSAAGSGTGSGPKETAGVRSALNELIKMDPDNPMYQKYGGMFDLKIGNIEDAYGKLDKAVELGDKTPDTVYQRGLAAWNLGMVEQANKDAADAIAADPGHEQAEALFKLTQKKLQEVKLNPSTRRPGTPRGEIESGTPKILREGMSSHADLLAEAERRVRVRDYDGALSFLRKVIGADPTNVKARQLRADALLRLGKNAASTEDSTRLIELAPENVSGYNMRSLAMNRMGQRLPALEDAESALRIDADSAMAHYNRAFALAGLGKRKEAVESLSKAAALDPHFLSKAERLAGLAEDADIMLVFGEGEPLKAPVPSTKNPWIYVLFALLGAAFLAYGLLRKPGWTAARKLAGKPEGEDLLIGRYRLEREVGAGGMGVVYEAFDLALERKVAIKRMRSEIRAQGRERFLAEAKTVAKLRHPHLVEIFSIEEEGDELYLIFEYVRGRSLSQMLREEGPLPLAQAKDLFKGVCAALEYAHGMNVVHRDLKPSNIMVDGQGAAKVMDFGVARQAQEALGRLALTQTVCGTPHYMAPEQEKGYVGRETDVYALGVCLHEVLTGKLPAQGGDVPPAVNDLLARALEPVPEKRLRTAREFWEALEKA